MFQKKKDSKIKYPTLMPLWISVFVDILGFTIILPFLPLLTKTYTTNPLIIGLLLSSNAIFGLIFGPLLGKLSDIYGRKPLLLISQAGTFVAFLILAFSNTLEMLFIARIVDGIFGGQFPISKAVIGDVIPPKERSKYMTNIGIAFTLASVIGPGTGGLLAEYFGIIGPGLLSSAIALFTFIFTAIKLQESLPTKIEEPPSWLVEMQKNDEKQLKGSLIHNSKVIYLLIMYWFLVLAAFTFETTFSLFTNNKLGFSEARIGILFSLMGIFQVFFRFLFFNKIRDRLGDVKTSLLGLGSYIVSYALLGFVGDFYTMMLVLFYISFSGACSRGIITGFMSRVVNFKNQGKIMGVTSSLDNLGQIVGPLLGTYLLSFSINLIYSSTLSLIAIITFIMSFRLFQFGFEEKTSKKSSESSTKRSSDSKKES